MEPSPPEKVRLEKNIASRLGTLVYPGWPVNCRKLTLIRVGSRQKADRLRFDQDSFTMASIISLHVLESHSFDLPSFLKATSGTKR